jgi:nitroreductase
MDIFEAMETCRAIRRLKADPVPDDLLQKLVHYATRAPSAGNSQLWRFLVVTDSEDKRFLGELFTRRFEPIKASLTVDPTTRQGRMMQSVFDLVEHFERVPATIFPCISNGYPPQGEPNPIFMWSSIYPATQNILLAARALGLGVAMTTFHLGSEKEIRIRFDIPEDIFIGATIPVGWPRGKYGPLNRVPDEDVTYWGRWEMTRASAG